MIAESVTEQPRQSVTDSEESGTSAKFDDVTSSPHTAAASAPETAPQGSAGLWDNADAEMVARIQERLVIVEQRLREVATHADPLADEASKHLVDAGGKRVRPTLALLVAELGDPSRPELIDVAVTVELTHLATLYHDDVMDSAAMRRGAPSAHSVWGNTVAILTGDLLFARASATVSGLGSAALLLQAQTFERLCLGQLHETVGPREGDDPREHYLQVLSDKTASLLATAARLGAHFAGCTQDEVDAVGRYGELVGIAFQLSDDVIDLAPRDAATGKTPGTDLREGVVTMPVLLLRERVAAGSAADDADLLAAIDGDLSDDDDLMRVVERLRAHPVLAQTQELAQDYARRAVAELSAFPAGPAVAALEAFAYTLVNRAR